MASTRELKNRIKSVGDTQKITNAMYLISSTKMRRARREAEKTKPYFDLLRREMRRLFAVSEGEIKSRYYDAAVDETQAGGNNGIFVITSDKGLAGSYNQLVVRAAQSIVSRSDSAKIYSMGDYGSRFFLSHGYDVDKGFVHSMDEPSLAIARKISEELLERFDDEVFDRLYIVYTDYTGGMSAGEATYDRLLPFDRDDFTPEGSESDIDATTVFEYDPGVEEILNRIIPSYLTGYIYSALVNSYSAEQNARMMAMDAANDNANELMDALTLEFNHLRQNLITQEITEISSGARSQKKSAERRIERKKKKKLEIEEANQ